MEKKSVDGGDHNIVSSNPFEYFNNLFSADIIHIAEGGKSKKSKKNRKSRKKSRKSRNKNSKK